MSKVKKNSKVLIALMISSLLLVVFLLVTYTVTANTFSQFKYAITIDAGSTHSHAILFRWKADKLNDTGEIEQVGSCEKGRGISSFADGRLESAADDLMECIVELSQQLDRATSLEHTFVYLGATAGMRMLNLSDPDSSAKIFTAIKTRFLKAGLQIKRVSIITGKEEGLFAWVAVNYLSRTFFGHSKEESAPKGTYGVLDMGGASAQIAQQVSDGEATDSVHIRLYGTNYTVHTYSNFCFGTEQALKRYYKVTLAKHINSHINSSQIPAPCLPKGVRLSSAVLEAEDNICTSSKTALARPSEQVELVGSSDFDQCSQVVDEILDPQVCEANFRFCFKQSSHPKEGDFFAISAYYYLTDVLNIKNKFDKIDFYQYLNETRKICESSQEALQERAKDGQINEKFLNKYCFQLTYLHRTLTKVYHFDEKTWSNLRFAIKIDEKYLGWVLGFMISESNAIPSEEPIDDILLDSNLYTIPSLIFLVVFVASAVCFWKRLRRKSHDYNPPSLSMDQVA